MSIYVGTCGFSYRAWVGPVYPEGTPQAKMLEVYSEIFPAVEIDSTYYRPPSSVMFKRYPQRTGGRLKVCVKLHSAFTHERNADSSHALTFNNAVAPLIESGMFIGFLAQFPPSFRATTENLHYLKHLRELFPEETVICEFREKGWWEEEAIEEVKKLRFPMVTVDIPRISSLPPNVVVYTTSPGYVRLHGRNPAGWQRKTADRYTYSYSKEELKNWFEKIRILASKTGDVYVFFNNHPFGAAAINAKELIEIIKNITPKELPDIPATKEKKLF